MITDMLQLLNDIVQKNEMSEWDKAKKKIVIEYDRLLATISSETPPFIYGVTSLVGHMDSIKLAPKEIMAFQKELINNHNLDIGFDYYNGWENKCILFAKIQNYSKGGSACSVELYESLLNAYFNEDVELKIPKRSSYSCGDVIPGSFFAKAIIENMESKGQEIKIKDGISLINGNYISLGLSLSTVAAQLSILDEMIDNSIEYYSVSKADTGALHSKLHNVGFVKHTSEYMTELLGKQNHPVQDAVSVRSTVQTIEVMYESIQELSVFLLKLLDKPSDNPLFFSEDQILSNASFMSPTLTVKISGVIEALLFTGWVIERRIHFLLSGKYSHISLNMSTDVNRLGLIQVPKLATNILEEARLRLSRRPFAAGSTTSYGIEDVWTLTTLLVENLNYAIDSIFMLLNIEKIIFDYIGDNDYIELQNQLKEIGSKKLSGEMYCDYKHLINILDRMKK